jgi:8-oxo-dGTP diphosphatase
LTRNGRVLVCRRAADQAHPLEWEFPGGKVEPGEDPRAALARELGEELGIRARVGAEMARYPYRYPGRPPILLVFYRVDGWDGEPRNLVFAGLEWAAPAQLETYDFLAGDVEFLRQYGGRLV